MKKTLTVIPLSLNRVIDQQISVFSFTFPLPWLLKQNSFFRNQLSSRFSVLYFLFSSLRSHHQPRAWSLIVHVRYTSLRGFTDEIAKFSRFHCLVISRRDWHRKKTKSNQEQIQKFRKGWPAHLPAIWILFILLRILVGGAWSFLSASTLNPPMQRNLTTKPRSHISNAGHLQGGEQRTTLNAVATAI